MAYQQEQYNDEDEEPEEYAAYLKNDELDGWEGADDDDDNKDDFEDFEENEEREFEYEYDDEYEYDPTEYGEIFIKRKNKKYISINEDGKIMKVKSLENEQGAFVSTPNENGMITLQSRLYGYYLAVDDKGKVYGIEEPFYFTPKLETMGKYSFKSQNNQWIYYSSWGSSIIKGSYKQRNNDHKFFILNTYTDESADIWNMEEIDTAIPLEFESSNQIVTFAGKQHKKRRKRKFTNIYGEQIISKGFIKKWNIRIIPNIKPKQRLGFFQRVRKKIVAGGKIFMKFVKAIKALTDPSKILEVLNQLNVFDIAEAAIEKLQALISKKAEASNGGFWQKLYDKLEILKDRERLKEYGARIIQGAKVFSTVCRVMHGDPTAFMDLLQTGCKFVINMAQKAMSALQDKLREKADTSTNPIWRIVYEKLEWLKNIKIIKKFGKMITNGTKMFMLLMSILSMDVSGFISLIDDFEIGDLGIDAIRSLLQKLKEKSGGIWKKVRNKLVSLADGEVEYEDVDEDEEDDKEEEEEEEDEEEEEEEKEKEPEMYYQKADITVGIQSVDGRVNKWYGYVGRTGKKATGNSKKMHKKGSTKGYGRSFRLNDEISIELDMNKYLLGFYINNDYQEKAFKVDPKGAYRLFVRINSTDYSIQFVDEEEEDF